jgi:hypothetical protein
MTGKDHCKVQIAKLAVSNLLKQQCEMQIAKLAISSGCF